MRMVTSLSILARDEAAITRFKPNELRKCHVVIMNLIRKSIEGASCYFEKIVKNRINKESALKSEITKLRLINDVIAISLRRYFIIPLVPPHIKNGPAYEVSIPEDFLYSWILLRPIIEQEPELKKYFDDVLGEAERYFKQITRDEGSKYTDMNMYEDFIRNAMSLLTDDFIKVITALPKDIEDLRSRLRLLTLPADTRPGLNVAKLIPHVLLTSAFTYILYIKKFGRPKDPASELELEVARLAALLHDIGKPFSWAQMLESKRYVAHTERNIVENLIKKGLHLENILNDNIVEALIALIINHHDPDLKNLKDSLTFTIGNEKVYIRLKSIGKLIQEADILSSAIDRVKRILEDRDILSQLSRILNKDEATVKKIFLKSGRGVWETWLNIDDHVIEQINKLMLSWLSDISKVLSGGKEEIKGVAVLGADIKDIQSFLRRESLRGVIASSLVINLVTLYALPRAIIELYGVPLECILYSGGGFVLAVIPSNSEISPDRLNSYIQNILDKEKDVSVSVVSALAPLYNIWLYTSEELSSNLATEKILFNPKEEELIDNTQFGYEKLCDVCYLRPAEVLPQDIKRRYGDTYLDKACLKLLDYGSLWYIHYKLDTLEKFGYSLKVEGREEVMRRLMAWLSGAQEWRMDSWEIAVVKVDGNLMGCFMASSINISEAMFRSILIDFGLKYGVLSALMSMQKILGSDAVTRTFSGILYAGGDDMLAIVPSYIAIPFVIALAKEFWSIIGGSSQLSIAVAVGKPKHDIWNLIDSANELLKICKTSLRENDELFRNRNKIVALLAFMHSEWQLFRGEVREMFDTYHKKLKLSVQPLIFCTRDLDVKLKDLKLITTVFGIDKALTEDDYIKALFDIVKTPDDAKEVINAVHELYSVCTTFNAISTEDKVKVIATYVAKSVAEKTSISKIGVHSFAEIVKEIITKTKGDTIPLVDIYLLAKIIRGGRR